MSSAKKSFLTTQFRPKRKAGFTLEGDDFKENLVVGVTPGSPADKEGVKVGYKVVKVAGVKVNSQNVKKELKKSFKGTKKFEIVFLIPQRRKPSDAVDMVASGSDDVKGDGTAEADKNVEEEVTNVDTEQTDAKPEAETTNIENKDEEIQEDGPITASEESDRPAAVDNQNDADTKEDTKDDKEEAVTQDEIKTENDGPFIAVRREVRSLSAAEADRFVKALKRMMQNENGPDTSEYLRISAYHGDYCAHRNEQFPTWHRAYLLEMEKGLQAADRKNGGDGRIALPYWDWTDRSQDTLVPTFVRKEFPGVKGLKEDSSWQLNNWDFEMPSDKRMTQMLEQAQINDMVDRFLLEDEHFKAATSEVSPDSIESPHDRIHMVAG